MEGLQRIGDEALFLDLFTITSEDIQLNLIQFFSIFGPIFGFVFTFDAINKEFSENTLHLPLSQPVHRDSVINGKFGAVVSLIIIFLTTTIFSIVGIGLIGMKIPIGFHEISRITAFWALSIVYLSLWAAIGLLFSILTKSPATSALGSISVWLFFSIFIYMFGGLIGVTGLSQTSLLRLSPSYLYTQTSSVLLIPKMRFIGPLAYEKYTEVSQSIIPNPLSLTQSLSIVWPKVIGIIAAMFIVFLIYYIISMKKEIRVS